MPIYQAFNGRTKAWVKYHFVKDRRTGKTKLKITDVKQRLPQVPFANVPIRQRK